MIVFLFFFFCVLVELKEGHTKGKARLTEGHTNGRTLRACTKEFDIRVGKQCVYRRWSGADGIRRNCKVIGYIFTIIIFCCFSVLSNLNYLNQSSCNYKNQCCTALKESSNRVVYAEQKWWNAQITVNEEQKANLAKIKSWCINFTDYWQFRVYI